MAVELEQVFEEQVFESELAVGVGVLVVGEEGQSSAGELTALREWSGWWAGPVVGATAVVVVVVVVVVAVLGQLLRPGRRREGWGGLAK